MDKPKRKFKNVIRSIFGQIFRKHAFTNIFITHNAFGIFSINSHINQHTGVPKIMYSKKSAKKAAEAMSKKVSIKEGTDIHFSEYKCMFCDGYHIGKNRQNKTKEEN